MKSRSLLAAVCIGMSASSHAAILFSENFGVLADGTAITTTNTTFTYVRTGSGTPVLEAQAPGSFSGSSGLMSASGTSITAVAAGGFTSFSVGTLSFSLTTGTLGTGSTFFFGVGTGANFSDANAFSGTQYTAAYQITNGTFQVRTGTGTGTWSNVGTTVLGASTSYDISVVFNGSSSEVSYGSGSIAAGSTDIYLNGSLLGNFDITDNVDVSAFKIYTQTSGGSFEIDNVLLQNEAVAPIPEPTTALLGALGLLGILRRRR